METEIRKSTKYAELRPAHKFCPVVVETLGTMGPETLALVTAIERHITSYKGEPRSASSLRQQIDNALQRRNASLEDNIETMTRHAKLRDYI